MISLGLGNIPPRRRDSNRTVSRQAAEAIGRREPSPAVLQTLSETIAWCSSTSSRMAELRSVELDPTPALGMPPLDQIGVEAYLVRRKLTYERAVQSINAKRAALVRDVDFEAFSPAKARGRLLLYEPFETVADGASAVLSHGFFDEEDAPPWDTWLLYSERAIFAWVPNERIADAQAGIDTNIVQCIQWCDWSRLRP